MSLSCKQLTVVALIALAACTDGPTEPATTEALPAFTIKLALPQGSTAASYGIAVDSVEIAIYQEDTSCGGDCCSECGSPQAMVAGTHRSVGDSTLIDTLIAWPATAEGFRFEYEIPPPPLGHVYYIYVGLRANGQEMFYGYDEVEFQRGRIVIPDLYLYYYGPGYDADAITVTPGDTAVLATDTLQFSAEASIEGSPLDTAYISWRTTDTTKAVISHTGRLTFKSSAAGGTFGIIGMIPNGVADTVQVTVPQPAAAIQKVSGDGQTAPALSQLLLPIVVRVRDAGNQPERGILVRFYPLGSTGSTVSDSLVLTDSLGLASTTVLLGQQVGGLDVEVFVVSKSSLKVSFHATIDPALPAPIIWVSDSFGVTGALRRVEPDGANRATILPISAAGIQQALPRWAPGRKRAAFSTDVGNYTGLALVNSAGDSSATFVDDESAFRARFSPDGSHIAFQCGGIQDDEDDGKVCVAGGVAGPLNGLSGGGNDAFRVTVTDAATTRFSGPSSYAWDPVVNGRIAIVRDSFADTTGYHLSAIYGVQQTGSGLTLLSDPVMDLGSGPLEIMGPMDWSPDGSTIVFSARTPELEESSLYLLEVASGDVTRLTTPPSGEFGDFGDRLPVFSPNGGEVLFLRVLHSGDGLEADWHVVKLSDEAVRQVGYEADNWQTSDIYALTADWSPDGQTLLLPGLISFFQTLYLVPASTSSNAEYLADRVLIGDASGGNSVSDQVGSWRP